MTVHELNAEQLEELRGNYFSELQNEDLLGDIQHPTDIPMSNVIAHYEGTYFVEDDFFFNLTND
jgi:hypothetical protein